MVTALILISIKYENQKSDAGRELVSREGEADCKECFGNDGEFMVLFMNW